MALRRLIYRFFFIWIIAAWLSIPIFLRKTFGTVSVDQLGFFLFSPDGTVGTDTSVYIAAAKLLLAIPFLYTIIVFFPLYILIEKFYGDVLKGRRTKYLIVLTAFLYVLLSLGAKNLIDRYSGPDIFAETFVPAEFGEYAPKKNLILLYVESLEVGFSDSKKFGRDLNSSINGIFPRKTLQILQAPGTGWTTAGMISSQCGVPLAPFMHNGLMHRKSPVLGSLTCLSDILSAAGYYQAFYVGPDLKFSGMDKFYLNHGFNRAWGKQEIDKSLDTSQLNTGWGGGVNDDTLLDIAYQDILDKSTSNKPYNVTIITTDNHAANGIVSPRCAGNIKNPQINYVIDCTNKFIRNFVDRLEKNGILKDAVLVVMGDHLFMNNSDQIQFIYPERYVYFNYVGGETDLLRTRRYSLTHFDVFPSILTMLGEKGPARVHLGSSIFMESMDEVSSLHKRVLDESILNKSALYEGFWGKK